MPSLPKVGSQSLVGELRSCKPLVWQKTTTTTKKTQREPICRSQSLAFLGTCLYQSPFPLITTRLPFYQHLPLCLLISLFLENLALTLHPVQSIFLSKPRDLFPFTSIHSSISHSQSTFQRDYHFKGHSRSLNCHFINFF